LESYIAHKGHVNTFNWNWKRAEHKLLVEPALTGIDPVGGNAAMGGCDWASTVDHMRAFTMTCKYHDRSQLFCAVVAHSPKIIQASDIPEVHKRQRKNLKKKGVHQKVQYKVAVLYASHAKNRPQP
jgi:hypothetical protein